MNRLMLLIIITTVSAHLIKADAGTLMQTSGYTVSTTTPQRQSTTTSTATTPQSRTNMWTAVQEQLGISRKPVYQKPQTTATTPTLSKMSTISLAWGETATPKETRLATDGSYYIYKLEDANYVGFVKQEKDSQTQCRKDKRGSFSCWTKTTYGWKQMGYPNNPKTTFDGLANLFNKTPVR